MPRRVRRHIAAAVVVIVTICVAGVAGAATVTLTGFSLSVPTVVGCKPVTGTVTLSATAPTGGTLVSLRSSMLEVPVPASVVVPAGRRTAAFTVKTLPVSAAISGTVTATLGTTGLSAPLSLDPMTVKGVIVRPTSIQGGETAWARASLGCAAGPGDITVRLASDTPSVARPTTTEVVVPVGRWDAYFMVTSSSTSVSRSVVLTAATGAQSPRRTTLSVTPATATASTTSGATGYAQPQPMTHFSVLNSYETSGLEMSVTNPGYAYVVDDGPQTTAVWALRLADGFMHRLDLAGYIGVDTEDLAVAPCAPASTSSCLYIGDIGDNKTRRSQIRVLRVVEPNLSTFDGTPLTWTMISLKYPTGAQNSETLLVDRSGALYTVTKAPGPDGTGAARLYGRATFTSGLLTDYGPVTVPMPLKRWAGKANVVTGGDAINGRVILRTYDHAVEYRGSTEQSLASFPSWPTVEVPTPREPKSEAITYTNGCGYLTASENVGDVFSIACPP